MVRTYKKSILLDLYHISYGKVCSFCTYLSLKCLFFKYTVCEYISSKTPHLIWIGYLIYCVSFNITSWRSCRFTVSHCVYVVCSKVLVLIFKTELKTSRIFCV